MRIAQESLVLVSSFQIKLDSRLAMEKFSLKIFGFLKKMLPRKIYIGGFPSHLRIFLDQSDDFFRILKFEYECVGQVAKA